MKKAFQIAGYIAIEKNGEVFLDAKRVLMLETVAEYGSINAAAKKLKMSYQQLWHIIKAVNELAPIPLLSQQRGGANGGGTEITSFGKRAIAIFYKLENEYKRFEGDINRNEPFDFF